MDGLAALEAHDLYRFYHADEDETLALRGVSFRVAPGETVAITGPSGSGKSTLLHLLGGLDTPTSGIVAWPGLGPQDALRPGRVVDVFQGPSLLPPLTILDNVRLPLLLLGIAEDEADAAATGALTLFGLAPLREKLPEEISGGQAQRVAIARAIAVRPMLVLADEPTGQLDTTTAFAVLDRFLAVLADIGAAILLSTHDERVAARLESRWTMRDGILNASADAAPCFANNGREQLSATTR